MITNISAVTNLYKCTEPIKRYLVYDCGLPLLGFGGNAYYFARTPKLEKFLKKMPLYLKIVEHFTKKRFE